MDEYDDTLICMSDEEWRAAAASRLTDLGLSYEELRERNRVNPTTAERKLWCLIGGTLDDPNRCVGTVLPARQFDELTATLHLPDPAPVLAAAARRPRRFRRE